jgi:predicted nuclease of predicted toxin-antitoxin system
MFLANENFPRPSIKILRDNGYEVKSIAETAPGISDEEVIRLANNDGLIILTFDSDYGELIFRYSHANPPSVVYFREKSNTPNFAGETLIKLLSEKLLTLTDTFTVVEHNGIRQRFYKK